MVVSAYLTQLKRLVSHYLAGKKNKDIPAIKHIATELAPNLKELAREHEVTEKLLHLEAAVEALRAEKEIEERQQLALRLAFKPGSNNGSLKAFMECLLYRPATSDELAVMSHFLWLCKRHVMGRTATYHMMPVIVGPQGCGKTETLKKLLYAGMGEYCLTTNFAYLEDERNTPALARNFIVFLDEMAKVNKTDVGNLKRLLTQESLTYRPMRTNDELSVKNNVTLIGASNDSIESLIKDKEMRRFYGLHVDVEASNKLKTAERMMHWEALKEIDMLSIWTSIDEGVDLLPEFASARDSISDTQKEELTTSDMFIEWIDSEGYVAKDDARVKVTDLMKEYRTFLNDLGSYYDAGIDPKAFRGKLKGAGLVVTRSNNNHVVKVGRKSKNALGNKKLTGEAVDDKAD